jgi:hypothetical protein
MSNEPAKEPKKEHFYDALKGPGHPAAGQRFPGNSKFFQPPMNQGGGRPAQMRAFGGASGRQGGRSR